ncbi:VWA domain-containing protein [Acidobacteria bacterium AH-259-D05]|nr:VWA domain-containing protein [Acidobacteria bacterium AH-259-D05]
MRSPCLTGRALLLAGVGAAGVWLTAFPLVAGQEATGEPSQRFEVNVETVVVNVLVTDQLGKPIPSLKKENFHLFEDGVEQEIQNFFPVDAPFSVALLLDTSYSTVGKLGRIQNSAVEFIHQIHPDDEVMVLSFDDEVYLDTDFTRSKEEAERAIKGTRTGGSTQLYEAAYIGLEELQEQPHRKVMVLFTDGIDSASPDTSASETIDFAQEKDVTIYTIFFDTETDALARLENPFPVPAGPAGTPGTIPGRNPGPLGIPGPSPLPVPMPMPMPPQRREPGGVGRREAQREEVKVAYRQAKYYLKELADVTGGVGFDAARNLSDLGTAFAKIAEEMRSLYSIGYISSNPKRDGKFREIKVTVNLEKGRVRARRGYYSGR